jgi:hypothetical protein
MRMGADAPTPEERLELSNAHQQAEAALAVPNDRQTNHKRTEEDGR